MFCQSCGAESDPDSQFCSARGHQFTGDNTDNNQVNDLSKKVGKTFIILGWVFFAISFVLIPILFGAGAFIMGYLIRKNSNETHGTILMVLAIAGAIIGSLLGMATY